MQKIPERSLTFTLKPDDCEALVAQLGKAGAHWTAETKVLSLYLDTLDSAIGKLGFGYGIRRRGDVTLNDTQEALRRFARGLAGQSGWTTFRHALSVVAPPDARELQGLLRSPGTRSRLNVVFQSEAKRSFWSVSTGRGEANLTLEQSGIVNGGKTRLASLTLTYPIDLAAAALTFIAEIGKLIPLRLTGEALALEAYRHAGRRDVAVPNAITPRLMRTMSTAAAFQTIAYAALDHFLLAQVRVRFLRDVEGVHQARVALRRFSAAWRLFSALVEGSDGATLKEDLSKIKDALRTARDLDVLLGDVATLAADDPALPTAPVRRLLEARRERAYDALIAALNASETDGLLLRLVTWIEAGDWTRDAARAPDRVEPFATFVQRKFSKLIQKFQRRCEALEQASYRERHRTRIRAKNLRYGVEFLDHLVRLADGKGLRRQYRALIGALKHMQSFLGEENDVLMAHAYFAGLGQDEDPVAADAATATAGATLAARLSPSGKHKFHKTVAKARRELFDVKPFWLDLAEN